MNEPFELTGKGSAKNSDFYLQVHISASFCANLHSVPVPEWQDPLEPADYMKLNLTAARKARHASPFITQGPVLDWQVFP